MTLIKHSATGLAIGFFIAALIAGSTGDLKTAEMGMIGFIGISFLRLSIAAKW